jgi:hypothetical protein
MCISVAGILLAWAGLIALDQTPPAKSAVDQLQALQDGFEKQEAELLKHYREAKSQEDRKKVYEQFKSLLQSTAQKALALAEQHAKEPVALKALGWVISNSPGGQSAEGQKAMAILKRDYLTSPDLRDVCRALGTNDSKDAEAFLRAVREKNRSREPLGMASYSLARILMSRAEKAKTDEAAAARAEAEALLEEVAAKYADVKIDPSKPRTLGQSARGALFEIRNLAIGKVAPDIVGTDSDNKPLKLSDFRGKVVLIDFWAHW